MNKKKIQKNLKKKNEEQIILINDNLISSQKKTINNIIVLLLLLFFALIISLLFVLIIHIKYYAKREFKKVQVTNLSISHNRTYPSYTISKNETKIKIKDQAINIISRNIKEINNILKNRNRIGKYTFSYRYITHPKTKLYWKDKKYIDKIKIKRIIRNYNDLTISFNNKEDFYKREKPKVSIVITIYNQEKFLNTSYAFIQNQTLKDIEIIYVDDNSQDNSSQIIKQLMTHDKRIVYLKNDKNKRAFQSRNRGILNSTGEYVLVIDPDDLLLNDILIKAQETAKTHNLDILQYYVMSGSYFYNRLWKEAKYSSGIIYNSTVSFLLLHNQKSMG